MSAAFVDHLWQSSLFAGCAWLFTLLLRKEGAHVRHWVWFAASVKFLLPFSWLATIGAQAGWHPVNAADQTQFVAQQLAAPLLAPATTLAPGKVDGSLLYIAATVWALGCAALLARWLLLWLDIRTTVRSASRFLTIGSVPVLTSRSLREPGVVGIFRPVLLLPEGIAKRLSSSQMQSILDHELCHVRRRDNLTAAVHMLVESLFWFHPLVWWIGARLVDERERACDEEVLKSGHEPRTYAEGILKVCQFYLASKLACVSGVSGAQLKLRLEIIMKNRVAIDLSSSKKMLLGVAALAAVALPLLSGTPARAADTKTTTASPATAAPIGKIELIEGKRVKLNYRNVEVRSLLQALAEAARANMLVSDKVSGTVTVSLAEMPWEQALDIVLRSQGLAKREKDGIIFIDPAADSSRA